MRGRLVFLGIVLVALSSFRSSEPQEKDGVLFRSMPCRQLPDMIVPRISHALIATDDEIVAIGGHTTGFVPTATAEYFKDGKWNLMETIYPHDGITALKLKNGKVLIVGGYSGDFGIGQSYSMEQYDPVEHRFSHLPILDRKRAHASTLELSDGLVLITGNWYAPDDMEVYTPGEGSHFVKSVSQERSTPFVLRSSADNALVFSGVDHHGELFDTVMVDRLQGEPLMVPLFQEWHPVHPHQNWTSSQEYEVGNYSYLIPVMNADGAYAAALVSGESFSLLPLEYDIPMEGPWGPIMYTGSFFTDKKEENAFLLGVDASCRVYLLKIGYGAALRGGKASLCVYYSQPIPRMLSIPSGVTPKEVCIPSPRCTMLPDGRFVLASGHGGYSFFDPSPVVCILSPGDTEKSAVSPWLVAGLCLAALLAVLSVVIGLVRRAARNKPAAPAVQPDEDLHSRLIDLMERQQFFRRKDARLSSVATELGTNATYISAVVNGITGNNFPWFLNGYRIRYAQQLMLKHPEMPLHLVADESGFPNESTFLRNFKAQTSFTPSEWKASQKKH